jgi:hypothetical protein
VKVLLARVIARGSEMSHGNLAKHSNALMKKFGVRKSWLDSRITHVSSNS